MALRTLKLTLQILLDGQLSAATTTEDRLLGPFPLRPDLARMIRQRRMAVFARVIKAAAAHLDGDDIGRPVIMPASRLRIEIQTADFALGCVHFFDR